MLTSRRRWREALEEDVVLRMNAALSPWAARAAACEHLELDAREHCAVVLLVSVSSAGHVVGAGAGPHERTVIVLINGCRSRGCCRWNSSEGQQQRRQEVPCKPSGGQMRPNK